MNQKTILLILGLLVIVVGGLFGLSQNSYQHVPQGSLDSTPQTATLSGTYVCLPHLDTSGPQTEECAFGMKTDAGDYYAVNFGQSAVAMDQFRGGAHVTAEGFIVIKEALSSDQWQKYNMKGIFTVTKMLDAGGASVPKITWMFKDVSKSSDTEPHTSVVLSRDGKLQTIGVYMGSCNSIQTENLLSGEISGALCWWAGGGNEIGIFKEGAGYLVKEGIQEEGSAETDGVRGNFKVLFSF